MLWRKPGRTAMHCMLASKEMVLPLTALSTEQEQKLNAPSKVVLNIHIVRLRNACKLYWFSSILERCLDEEQTFNISAVESILLQAGNK